MFRIKFLITLPLGLTTTLSCSHTSPGSRRNAEDELRLAAFQRLAASQHRSHSDQPICLSVRDDDVASPGRNGPEDPSANVLSVLRRAYPTARPRSECESNAQLKAQNPVFYEVGQVEWKDNDEAIISFGYSAGPLNAAQWMCPARRHRAGWTIATNRRCAITVS